jgi:hypothetical protein
MPTEQTEFQAEIAPAAKDITSHLSGEPDAAPRQNRKLPERILVAAHQACDLDDLDVAARLLSTLESVIIQKGSKADPQHRHRMKSMIAAHHRLWQLRVDDLVSKQPSGEMPRLQGGYILEASGR